MDIALLLDGKTGVSSRELACNIFLAAFLGLEKEGIIEFEAVKDENKNTHSRLVVIPQNKENSFPAETLEARLDINQKDFVSNIVYDWLLEQSDSPANRAVEHGMIMLAIRNLAIISKNNFGMRKYLYSDTASGFMKEHQNAGIELKSLMEDFDKNRPEISKLLKSEISEAIRKRTNKSNKENPNPDSNLWLLESQSNRQKFNITESDNTFLLRILYPVFSLVLWFGWGYLTISLLPTHISIGIVILVGLYFALNYFKFKPIVNLERIIKSKFRVQLINRNAAYSERMDELFYQVMAYPVLGIVCLLVVYFLFFSNFLASIITVLVMGNIAYQILKTKAIEAINERVLAKASNHENIEQHPGIATEKGLERAPSEERTPPVVEKPQLPPGPAIRLNVMHVNQLPPPSEASKRVVEGIGDRGDSYYRIQSKVLRILMIPALLLALIYWLSGPDVFVFRSPDGGDFTLPGRMPIGLFVCSLFTFLIIKISDSKKFKESYDAQVIEYIAKRKKDSSVVSDKSDLSKKLRPVILIILTWLWMFTIMNRTDGIYPELKDVTGRYVFTLISLLHLVVTYLYMKWERQKLEKKYPVKAPVNLLALRVFGSPYLSDFLVLTNSWQMIGTRQRLDGPDMTGYKKSDVVNYMFGKINDSIVEDETELNSAIEKFSNIPDKHLRYPLNSLQCMDKTWKQAFQILMDRADVVVMDLSGLSPKNKGVAYEMEQLLNQFSADRIVFLINDSTDMKVLQEVMTEAWNKKEDNSPNKKESVFNFIHTGTGLERTADESLYDWKKRLNERIDETQLICLLCDASQPLRNSNIKFNIGGIKYLKYWTRLPISSQLRTFIYVILAIYFLTSVTNLLSVLFK